MWELYFLSNLQLVGLQSQRPDISLSKVCGYQRWVENTQSRRVEVVTLSLARSNSQSTLPELPSYKVSYRQLQSLICRHIKVVQGSCHVKDFKECTLSHAAAGSDYL